MATTRLRKAFRYPSESDEEDEPDELDEEHQERLIADFQAEDAQKNELYRKAFLTFPLLGATFFLYAFIVASTARARLISIMGLSSLTCTAYILHYMPIKAPERKGKRPIYQVEAEKSPVEKYLLYMNIALAGLLLIAAALSWQKALREAAWKEALPAIILALTMFVRQQLAPLDFEDLNKARYEYKGA